MNTPRFERSFCVTIDLDDLRFYRAIHALAPADDFPVIFVAAVPRFLAFCDRIGVRATLFAIAEDLRWPEAREALRSAAGAAHEVASHSFSHAYDLCRHDPDRMVQDLSRARAALEDAIGSAVVGFRAPGYNLSAALLRAIAQTGHRYDASILPSPAYFAARATVIGAIRLRGRRSASIVGRARDFLRSRDPFFWRNYEPALLEFPITACGLLRWPFIGTTLARGGVLATRLATLANRLPFVQVEFHALDFLDLREDRLDADLSVEPALRVPLADRLAHFETAMRTAMAGHRPRLLRDLAAI